MLENQKCDNYFFVVMGEARGGKGNLKLKSFFKEQFQSPFKEAKVEVFTYREILQHFEIDYVKDELEGINKIIDNLKPNTAIFFDETPIVRTEVEGEATDWTDLKSDHRNIFVTISFQPLIESVQKNLRPVKPSFPKNASILELNRVYRSSKSIFKCVQDSIQYENGIRRMECEASSTEFVTGREPIIISYRPPNDGLIILWIQDQISKMKCKSDKITILYTPSTEEDALRMFTDCYSLSSLDEFRGCENNIIICFYSSDDDETWQLMAMASRARQMLIIINKIVQESKSAFTEITHAQHYSLEKIKAEFEPVLMPCILPVLEHYGTLPGISYIFWLRLGAQEVTLCVSVCDILEFLAQSS